MSSRLDHLTKAALKARTLADINSTSDEEDAEIHAAALSDPDNPPDILARSRPVSPERAEAIRARAKEAQASLIRRGRPPAAVTKEIVTMRLDRDLLERLRADGRGWQTRANELLRKAVGI
jgi:uncharacterized protein (DUF4415 family)